MPVIVDVEKCDGCGTCQDECPSAAIKVENEKAVINKDECIECSACQDACPSQAVELKT